MYVMSDLTIRQMMKLVIFAAAASMCLAPHGAACGGRRGGLGMGDSGRGRWYPGGSRNARVSAVRRGPSKDWLIRMLLFTSVSIAPGSSVYSLIWGGMIWAGTGATRALSYFVMIVLTPPFVGP